MSRKVNYRTIANGDWILTINDDGTANHDALQTAALYAIRDELRALNAVLNCPNLLNIQKKLDRIGRNTSKAKRKKVRT